MKREKRLPPKRVPKLLISAIKSTFPNEFRQNPCIYQKKVVTLQPKVAKVISYEPMLSKQNILSRIQTLGRKVLPEGSHLLLYGSRARGDNHTDSDWDLLVLLNRPQNENVDFASISYPLMELGFDLGQYFSVHTYSQQEWSNMSFTPFYKNVERDKIQLV